MVLEQPNSGQEVRKRIMYSTLQAVAPTVLVALCCAA